MYFQIYFGHSLIICYFCTDFRYYKQQQELLNAWKNSPFQSGYGGVPNYAYATGAFGPSGVHQTAGVFPPNKVSHRFLYKIRARFLYCI